MKPLTILLLLMVLSNLAWGQDTASQAIQGRLDQYFEATKSKDWVTVVDLLYPKLFNMMEKQDMVQLFKDMEGNGVEFQIKSFELHRISEIVQHQEEVYARVDYTANMNIRFTSEAYKEPDVAELIRQNYASTYGEENVQYLPEDNSFNIRADKAMYTIAPEGSAEWTFIESDSGQEGLISSMIPSEVREKFQKEMKE